MQERITDISKFIGLRIYEDPTKAPAGSAREMVNLILSDRGGIKKRQGVSILGAYNSSAQRCRGFFVFRKSDSTTEIPIKFYDDELEYYHPDALAWARLKNGYTVGSDFGFKEGLVRSGNDDYVYYGNKTEPDARWNGAITQLNGALAGGETTIVVDSVLRPDIYHVETASASTATTLDIATAKWVNDQWINFYVYIKAGAQAGKIRKITDNTTTQITFDTLGADPGDVEFEIRYPKFPASGTLIVNGNTLAYSAIPEYNKFTTSAAVATPDNSPVALVPEEAVGNPRGNRMEVLRGRRYVANVRSGVGRDSSGNPSGIAQPGSVFVSKVCNSLFPTADLNDFAFANPRVAGEGDIIAGAYGGEGHTDIRVQEDAVYMFKPKSIESVKYTQDANDLATLTQVSTSYGSIMQSIKGSDDIYFITSDKQFTSLGRVVNRDVREQALNIGLPVKRLLESYGYDSNAKGAEFKNRIHIPVKSTDSDTNTNRLLVYNMNGRFEGEWWMNIDKMDIYNNELYASQSNSANVIKLYEGLNDVYGDSVSDTQSFEVNTIYKENWLNLLKSKFGQQEVNLFACEGYILGNTRLTFNLYKDLSEVPFLTFQFAGTEDQVDNNFENRFLGSLPKGIKPIGNISTTTDNEGMRHFMFLLYFPFVHSEWISWGFTCQGKDTNFEILRAGMNFSEDTINDFANRVKTIV